MPLELFEHYIDALDIDSSIKTAVKKLHRICLEGTNEDREQYEKINKDSVTRSGHGKELTPEEAKRLYAPNGNNQSPTQNPSQTPNPPVEQKTPSSAKVQTKNKIRYPKMNPSDVEALQIRLNEHGAKIKVDKKLGPTTTKALQKISGLKVTGIWDRKTQLAYVKFMKSQSTKPNSVKTVENTPVQKQQPTKVTADNNSSSAQTTNQEPTTSNRDVLFVNKLLAIPRKLPRYKELRDSLKEQIENAIINYRKTKNIKDDKSYISTTLAAMGDNQSPSILQYFTQIINGITQYA